MWRIETSKQASKHKALQAWLAWLGDWTQMKERPEEYESK